MPSNITDINVQQLQCNYGTWRTFLWVNISLTLNTLVIIWWLVNNDSMNSICIGPRIGHLFHIPNTNLRINIKGQVFLQHIRCFDILLTSYITNLRTFVWCIHVRTLFEKKEKSAFSSIFCLRQFICNLCIFIFHLFYTSRNFIMFYFFNQL